MSDFEDDFEDDFEEYISDEEPAVKSSPVVASPIVAAPKSSSTPVPNEPLSRQVKEMMKAMEQENSSLRSASPSQAPSSASNNSGSSSRPNQSATSPAVSNPSMLQAKTIKIDKPLTKEELKQQELARKKAERSRELLRIVDLDLTRYIEYIDIPPKSESELYQLSFGVNSTHSHTSVQCPPLDDLQEGSTMTDRPIRVHKSIQAPDDLGFSVSSKKTGSELYRINPVTLSKFLKQSSNVISRLLEERSTVHQLSAEKKSVWKFSESFSTFFHPGICAGRSARDIVFLSLNEIGVSYTPTQKDDALIQDKGLICIWSVSSPTYPSKILICESEITCISYVPHYPHFILGGTSDGTLQIWDLREVESKHKEVVRAVEGKPTVKIITRNPTYSSDWMLNQNHYSAILQIIPLGYNKSSVGDSGDVDQYQITTIDREGTVIYWSVIRMTQEVTSETDFGLSMSGGRVKLISAGQVNIFNKELNRVRVASADDFNFGLSTMNFGVESTDDGNEKYVYFTPSPSSIVIESEPRNSLNFIIGLSDGSIQRESRVPRQLIPKVYNMRKKHVSDIQIEEYGYISNNSISCTSIHYSIYLPQYFVASFSDGSISIYREDYPDPVYRLHYFTFKRIQTVRWSPYVPSQFYVLVDSGELALFDLLKKGEDKLVLVQNITVVLRSVQTNSEMRLKPSSNLVFPQFDIHGRLMNVLYGGGEVPQRNLSFPYLMTVGYSNGRVDLHRLALNNSVVESISNIRGQIDRLRVELESMVVWNVE